ncbi:MAG: DUF4350 domain-containing protein, partial [Armatimonadota bacterium]
MLFVTLTVIFARGGRRDPIRDHSSVRTNAWGTRALAELTRARGLPATAWDRPLTQLSERQRLLCLFDPSYTQGRYDVQALLEWVRRGGHLVLATDLDETHNLTFATSASTAGPDEVLLAALGLVGESKGGATGWAQAGQPPQPELRDVRAVYVPGPYRLRPGTQADFKRLAGKIPEKDRERLRLEPLVALKWETVLADGGGAVLLRATHGRGTIQVLSEVEILGNKNLLQGDNVVFAANLLFDPRAPKVYFDEAVHLVQPGLSEEAQELDPRLVLRALGAVMVAIAWYLISAGWRFGAPVPLSTTPRRSALEFVNALADLYRRAGARDAVLELLRQSFRRKLALAAGVAPDLPTAALAAAGAAAQPAVEDTPSPQSVPDGGADRVTNSIGMSLIKIPMGEFKMGERNNVRVRLSRDFL